MEFPSQGDMTLFVIAMFTITRLINFVESRRQRRHKLHMQDAPTHKVTSAGCM